MFHYDKTYNFDPGMLNNPKKEFSPVYSWIWNSEINKDIIKAQIDEMEKNGIRAAYIIPEPKEFRPGNMDTEFSLDYLSEEFFEYVKFAAEYAAGKGFLFWLYDEGGWPSGSACGQVVKKYPQSRAKKISKCLVQEANGINGEIIAVYDGNYNQVSDISKGMYIYYREDLKTIVPHLLNEKAIEEFLNITYERYAKCMKDIFGRNVYAVFTDEAILYYPYYLEDVDEFEKLSGYDFKKYLPALFDDVMGEDGRLFKIEYIDYCMKLFSEKYVKKLHNWADKNGLLFTGHMDGDHLLETYSQQVGNALYHIRNMDIPGVDVIWRHIFPGKKNFFPRIASSAAHQIGREYAMSESFAVYGDGLTYEQMRYIAGYQFVRGINIINPMSITSGRDGFLWAQCRPHFNAELLQSDYQSDFNQYLSNMTYLCSIGKSCNDIALYMPMRDIWAGRKNAQEDYYRLGNIMEENQISFDIADDDYICESEITSSGLGKAGYKTIVLPETKYIKKETLNKLDDFKKQGGEVLYSKIPEGAVLCDCKFIRVLKRKSKNESIYILFNDSEKRESFNVTFHEEYTNAYRISAATGKIYNFNPDKVHILESGEELIVIYTKCSYNIEKEPEKGKMLFQLSEFEMTLEKQNILRAAKPELIEQNKSIECWDRSISGRVRYKTEFLAKKGKSLMIDLGDVKYFAEVYLNGNNIGRRIMPPYILYDDGGYVEEKNILEIVVTNTAANMLYCGDYNDISKNIIGPYHEKTLEFEKESTDGGLKSPVKIYYAD